MTYRNIFAGLLACAMIASSCCSNECCCEGGYEVPAPEDVMMYQVNPRVFAPEKSFNAVAEHLDSIRALGTNVVWFMPTQKRSGRTFSTTVAILKKYILIKDLLKLADGLFTGV